MRLQRLAEFAAANRRGIVVGALLSTFSGVTLIIDRPKGTILEWVALPLLGLGALAFTWAVWPATPGTRPSESYLFSRLLSMILGEHRPFSFFPALGVAFVLSDLAYNLLLSASSQLLTEDIIVLLLGCTLISYPVIPGRFGRERDFVLGFFFTVNLILVLPLLAFRVLYQDFERSVDVYSWVALAPETSGVLTLIGVSNFVHAVPGATAPGLTFVPRNVGTEVTVVITTACSGIYSFGIFASAFVAFVLTEYEKLTRRVWAFLAIGLLTSYVANVLRMTVIILVGYYTDSAQTDLQNMLFAHSYAGWLIFLGWIALFWGILFRVLPSPGMISPAPQPKSREQTMVVCSICREELTPAIPAERCACHAYYHRACISSRGACPSCGSVRTVSGQPGGDPGQHAPNTN